MKRSLIGWIRIGIVASAFWLLCAATIVANDYLGARAYPAPIVSSLPPLPQGAELIRNESAFTLCTISHNGEASCTVKASHVATLALLPIGIGWAVVLILIVTVRWVAAGFRGKQT